LDRDGDDLQPTAAVGAHEVGDVGDSDGLLSSLPNGLVAAGRRERLDRGRVEAAVHEPPRLVVTFVGGDSSC
jgi:hypothetical protein